jgi:hypothetical protein
MDQNRKTAIIMASIILIALIVCGLIGYTNDPRRGSSVSTGIDTTLTVDDLIDLDYCYSPATDLCVISFGADNANNSLIVIKNNDQSLKFYLKITGANKGQLYECEQVQFSSNIFYCSGAQLHDGTLVTIEVYSKNDNRLVASGLVLVSLNATPTPDFTGTPITATTPPSAIASETKTPSYPNPPYPNPPYPNP